MKIMSLLPFTYTQFDDERYIVIRREGKRFYWVVFDADYEAQHVFYSRPLGRGVSGSLERALMFARLWK